MQCTQNVSKIHDEYCFLLCWKNNWGFYKWFHGVYGDSFDKCLENLSLVLKRCIETTLVLNYKKCYSMVEKGIVLGHVVFSCGVEVDNAKIDVISSLPYPSCVR